MLRVMKGLDNSSEDLLPMTNLMGESDLADHSRKGEVFKQQLSPRIRKRWHFGKKLFPPPTTILLEYLRFYSQITFKGRANIIYNL